MDGKAHATMRQPRASAANGPRPLAVGPHAVVRLHGVHTVAPQVLLQLADGVRRAMSLIGIAEVRVEVDVDEGDAP